MEDEVEGYNRSQEQAHRWEDALHASASESCDEQPEFLSTLPLHLSTEGLQGNAKYEQQD